MIDIKIAIDTNGDIFLGMKWLIKVFGVRVVYTALYDEDCDWMDGQSIRVIEYTIYRNRKLVSMDDFKKIFALHTKGIEVFTKPEQESETLALLNE